MKGVSPVIATVLMVAVAIAAAVVAYSWFMSMQASVQAEASRGAGTVGKERFTVEAVSCSGGNLTVHLRNIGDEEIDGQFTFTVKDAATGTVLDVNRQPLYIGVGDVNSVTFSVSGIDSNCYISGTTRDRIVVEAVSPGGATNSKQERI